MPFATPTAAARVKIETHLTLVFATAWLAEQEFAAHIASVAARTPRIEFACKYAMLGADDEDDRAYVFLVPDEGYAAISILHDRLYTGPLAEHLRLDIPYVPHITVATLRDRAPREGALR